MTPEQPTTTEIVPKSQGRQQSMEMFKLLMADTSGNYRHLVEELVRANNDREIFDQDWRTAKQFALSGNFADITGTTQDQAIAQALVKIQMGRNWGMLPADAMANVFFINGKPGVATDYLASKIQQAGYSWDAQWHEEPVEYKKGKTWDKCIGCTLWLKAYNRQANHWEPVVDRDGKPVKASFTEADAENAMIWEKEQGQQRAGQKPLAEKWNYKSWGRDMYFWSAMRRLRKYYLTGILRGAIQVEMADYEVPIEAAPPQQSLPEPAQSEPPKKSLRDFVLESEQPGLLEE